MSHRSFFISAMVLVLLLSASVRSQGPTPAGRGEESAELKQKATDLLLRVVGQIETLRSAQNRARIGSNAADALWDYDEKRARSLFAAVGEDIRAGFTDADPDLEKHNHTLLVFWQLRSDTLGRIAKHDPEFALEFLRATRMPADIRLPTYQTEDSEKSQELRLAQQIAAKNPELALKIGRQGLEQGFSGELLSVLSTLQARDKGAALNFYKEIMSKLKSVDLSQDWAARQVAFTLARTFQPPQADEQAYRDLIGILMSSALANGCGKPPADDDQSPEICYELGGIFPQVEKYYGSRAIALKRWAQDAQQPDAPQSETWEQIQELTEKGSVDEILAAAAKSPDYHYPLYRAAISKAEAAGDFARARQIVPEFSSNEEQRSEILAEIDRTQKRMSTNPNNPASIQQALSTFHNDEERIGFLLASAGRTGANDRKAALEFLDQAGQIVDSTKGKAQLEGQIALALMHCSLKSERGFMIVESLIPRLNQLVAAAATLDGVENDYLSDDEWNMTGAGQLGRLLTALAQNAGWFARLDFDRSVTIANQLERPELRLMTVLKIAQGVLGDRPNPSQIYQLPYVAQ